MNIHNRTTGTLIRNYREGPSKIEGFADDYSFLISGLLGTSFLSFTTFFFLKIIFQSIFHTFFKQNLDLYESCFDIRWLQWAVQLQEKQNELFLDADHGGFFAVKKGDPTLKLRMKEGVTVEGERGREERNRMEIKCLFFALTFLFCHKITTVLNRVTTLSPR